MANYRDGRAYALGVVGAVATFATAVGEFMMHNPALAQDILHCADSSCLANKTGTLGYEPLPATVVMVRNGSTLDITHYQVIVLGLGVMIFASALAWALRTTDARRLVLAFAAVSLALTLVFFHAQAPMLKETPPAALSAILTTILGRL